VVEQASAEIAAAAAEATRTQYDLDRYRTLSAVRFASIQRFEQRRALGKPGRDRLGADLLSDRRDRGDSPVRLA
jgi:multidrug resistance efflux pump